LRNRIFERTRERRDGGGGNQQDCECERAEAFRESDEH